MQFIYDGQNQARPLRFIEGPLSRFDGLALLIGYGEKKALTRRRLIPLLRKALQFAKNNEVKAISLDFKELRALAPKAVKDTDLAQLCAEAFMMANYEHTAYKTISKNKSVETVQ